MFLKAGLLVLEANTAVSGQGEVGSLAFSFIAGYNVEGMLGRLEDAASSVWGIGKTSMGTRVTGENQEQDYSAGP